MIRLGMTPNQIIAAMPEVLRLMPNISNESIIQMKLNRTNSNVHIETLIKNKKLKVQGIDEELSAINTELIKANNLITQFVKFAPQYAQCRRDPKFAERLANVVREYQNSADLNRLHRDLDVLTRIHPSRAQLDEFMSQARRAKYLVQSSNPIEPAKNIVAPSVQKTQDKIDNRFEKPKGMIATPEMMAIIQKYKQGPTIAEKDDKIASPIVHKSPEFLDQRSVNPRGMVATLEMLRRIRQDQENARIEYERKLIELQKFAHENHMNWYEKPKQNINHDQGPSR